MNKRNKFLKIKYFKIIPIIVLALFVVSPTTFAALSGVSTSGQNNQSNTFFETVFSNTKELGENIFTKTSKIIKEIYSFREKSKDSFKRGVFDGFGLTKEVLGNTTNSIFSLLDQRVGPTYFNVKERSNTTSLQKTSIVQPATYLSREEVSLMITSQINQAGLTGEIKNTTAENVGPRGPQGLTGEIGQTGPRGPKGDKGEDGARINSSDFVTWTSFENQIERIYDSINEDSDNDDEDSGDSSSGHDEVTIGTASGLSLSDQVLSLGLSSATTSGSLSSSDWNIFNNKQSALVSGTNIKTINGTSILGSGNIVISGGGGSMVYPDAGIPVSTGSAWGASIADNSSNWNTAYGWGNHADAGYLTGYTETDPVFSSWNKSTGISITKSQISDFETYSTDIHANISALNSISGTNTGDETISSIKTKLGITTLSGSNTGDQDLSGYSLTSHNHSGIYASSLGTDDNYVTDAEKIIIGNTSGVNTGDETISSIKTKLGITTLSGSNTGDQDLSGYSLTSHNHSGIYAPTLGGDDNYVTDAEKIIIGNTSGTNTGDQNLSGYMLSSSFTDTSVTGKLLTGYVSGSGVISSTDTVLQAIQKLNGNMVASGSGTVSSISVTTANGVSAVITNPTTTPDLTFTLGAITPSSVGVGNLNLNGNTISSTSGGINLTPLSGQKLTITGNTDVTGDLVPTSNNTYNLGSATNYWHSMYVGPGSIYVDGQKVLQTDISDSVVVSSDDAQNLILKTSEGGNIELNPATGLTQGQILLKGNVVLTGTKTFETSDNSAVIFADGISSPSFTTSVLNGGISITPNGTGNTYVTTGKLGIGNTSPSQALDVTGNILASGTILGSNLSGTNTGDETISSIKTKLGITTLSGSNTGDQDLSGYSLISHNHSGIYAPTLGGDDNYVTDAEKIIIGNTSGTNTGDNAVNSLYSGLQANIDLKAPLASPIFTTNITTPLIIGGTTVGSNIIYKSTTGVGSAAGIAHQFVGGTDGGTVLATILNNGKVGIGTTLPLERLDIVDDSGNGALHIGNTVASNSGSIRYEDNDFQGYNGTSWKSLTSLSSVTKEATGFPNRTDTTLSFNNTSREFTITGTNFKVYSEGSKFTKNTESINIPNVTGIYYVYYNASTQTLTQNTLQWSLTDGTIQIATVYWDSASGVGLIGEERHGLTMDGMTHEYLHTTVGSRYNTGFTGTFNADNTFSITAGSYYDEDILNSTSGTKTNSRILYKNGTANFTFTTAGTSWMLLNGTNIRYNNANSLTNVTNNNFVAYWVFATNDSATPIYTLIGQRQDSSLNNARTNATYESLSLGNLPFKEMKLLYRVIIKQAGSVQQISDVTDYRTISNLPSGTYVASSHSILTGLTNDDHLQYLNINGRLGGQTAIGGKDVADILKLQGTSANGTLTAPAIQMNVGNAGATNAFTVLNDGSVGIGTTTPLSKLVINGGLHVGGDSDAGDNNILADGTISGSNLSGTNTGDETISSIKTKLGITTLSGDNTGDNAANSLYSGLATSKQDALSSGVNIKTVGGLSLLGSGDLGTIGDSYLPNALTGKTYNGVSLSTSAGSSSYLSGDGSYDSLTSSQWTTTSSNIYYNTGRVFIGASSEATSSAKLYLEGSTSSADGPSSAIVGILGGYTFNPTEGGIQVGNRFVITNNPTLVANTSVAEMIRTVDNTTLENLIRGIDVTSNAGSNTAGINTGIRGSGATFGVQGVTNALAGGTSVPAALYGESTGTTQGDVLRLYSKTMTSASSFATFYHDTSAFTGTGLLMDFATGSGSFTGNFVDFQKNNTPLFRVTNGGVVVMGLSSTAATSAICSSLANGTSPTADTAYEIRDCSSIPVADYAEMYPMEKDAEYGDIMIVGNEMVDTYDTGSDGAIDWNKTKGTITKLVKSNKPYQSRVIGVVSDNHSDFSSVGYNIKEGDNPKPIAMNGRVPVKISPSSEDIKAGDYLTTSADAGMAMKATRSGFVIGKALESWSDDDGKEMVMFFVEQGFYDSELEGEGLEEISVDGLVYENANKEFVESIKFMGGVEFNIPPLFNSDTAGFAIIKAGSDRVDVIFDNPYISSPVVNVTVSFEEGDMSEDEINEYFADGIQSIVTNKTQSQFTIRINKKITKDVRFSWVALAVRDPKVFVSVIEGLQIDQDGAGQESDEIENLTDGQNISSGGEGGDSVLGSDVDTPSNPSGDVGGESGGENNSPDENTESGNVADEISGEKANTETDQAQPATSTDAESEKVSAEETDSTGAEDSGEPATSSEGATSSEAPAESSGEGAID